MNSLKNIIKTIESFLDTHNECSEHSLIQHLRNQNIVPFTQLDLKHTKDLFSAHFLVMHALYHLQNNYFEEQTFTLDINSIKITRSSYVSGQLGLAPHNPVKDYYLDIRHYFETDEDQVNDLLNKFWKKFLARDDKHTALNVLGLPVDANYQQIKLKYKSLAQQHHPDKGGNKEDFTKIYAAKKLLDRAFL